MLYIRSKSIYFEDGVRDGFLVVEGKKIVGFLDSSAEVEDYIDYSNYRIIPGIFDTHHHANHGYSPNGLAGGDEEVLHFLKGAASSGVSNIFPTVAYMENTGSYDRLYRLSLQENDGATILGIHSEDTQRLGHRVGEKADPIHNESIDMNLVKATWENSHGMLKLCGIAPELPGSDEAIEYLVSKGVRVAFMHSEADYATARAAFKKGITVSTHTANVMSGIHHRRMGGLGACLLDADLNCEVICDGLHISPEMLELMFRVKQDDNKWMMVSDNIMMAGGPVGTYKAEGDGNLRIITEEGYCLSPKGRLCGSTKPVLYGMKVLCETLGKPLETVIRYASLNPAVTYGFGDTKGSIMLGKDCDLAVIDQDYNCVATYANGRKVFDRDIDKDLNNIAYFEQYQVK